MQPGKYIAYYRVSTDKQGRSGLGLDAQQKAVADYLNGNGSKLAGEYIEVESGKKLTNRPELQAALEHCRKKKATLIIAKLDRLARSVHFIAGLMESGVAFVAADMPSANDFMLHIYAAVAQEERRLISQRTRAALRAAKAKGVKLGNPKLGQINDKRRRQADEFAALMAPIIAQIKEEGYTSFESIRDELNRRKVPTARDGSWHTPTVYRLVKRIERIGA